MVPGPSPGADASTGVVTEGNESGAKPVATTEPVLFWTFDPVGAVTVTASASVTMPPAGIVPTLQVTTPAANDPPPVAEANWLPAGTPSVTTTPVAAAPPVFSRWSV